MALSKWEVSTRGWYKAYLADQLQRAGTSVPLNIAEGAGEYAANEKCRFYRMAKHSATECASIFDVCLHLKLIDEKRYRKGRELLIRIVSMLTRMVKIYRNEFKNGEFDKKVP